ADEVGRRGDGDRAHLRRGVPQGAPLARAGRPRRLGAPRGSAFVVRRGAGAARGSGRAPRRPRGRRLAAAQAARPLGRRDRGRELPAGVVIQFGGQTPLKLAREIEAEGWGILGTPFEAVDLAEDRERFAALCEKLEIDVPSWSMAEGAAEAAYVAEAIGYPVLVRPSYVLGGRNMQVCYDDESVAAAAEVGGRVLIDRFLEGAIEIDVDALCDGRE